MGTYVYDKGDISKAENIVAKFEENVSKAQHAIEISDESSYFKRMENGDQWKFNLPSYA